MIEKVCGSMAGRLDSEGMATAHQRQAGKMVYQITRKPLTSTKPIDLCLLHDSGWRLNRPASTVEYRSSGMVPQHYFLSAKRA